MKLPDPRHGRSLHPVMQLPHEHSLRRSAPPYDALLLGFLRRAGRAATTFSRSWKTCSRGKNVPRERLLEVAEHYELFGGVSPINAAEPGAAWPRWSPSSTPTARRCRSTGAIATGIRCWPTRCRRWPTTACAAPWPSSPRPSAPIPAAGSTCEDIEQARQAVGAERPADRQAAAVLQSSGLHRADGRTRGRGARRASPTERRGDARGWSSPPTASRVRWPRERPLRGAAPRGVPAGLRERLGRDRWDLVYQSRSGPPIAAVAGAGHPRPPAQRWPQPAATRRGARADRLSCPSTWRWSTISTSRRPLCATSSTIEHGPRRRGGHASALRRA